MRTIPHRELRNNSSKVLADVKAGETIAVTNNGEVTAILVPPGLSKLDQLIASGRVTPAKSPGHAREIKRVKSKIKSIDVLNELRGDR
ncbi:MAG: type II toxin-antitoxin system prevent-host-death family antitoxin [Propionibacteriales bacterium]|nr:type II toxin-antitoxin system prevent-host-death family antitoxin [Propionibacteriales bacterium]HZK36790.1 type II toxin-antitoxin system prevent-host-death family antitoxin [Aeromicrobium sp.]